MTSLDTVLMQEMVKFNRRDLQSSRAGGLAIMSRPRRHVRGSHEPCVIWDNVSFATIRL